MKKIIFIGRSGSGKTTLCQSLNDLEFKYKKTQAIEVYSESIDTPGEYLENRHYYASLITTAADARIIAVLADPTKRENYIPPSFSGAFSRKVIGIITKITLADKNQILKAEKSLKEAGIKKIFQIDTIENVGLEELFEYIDENAEVGRWLKSY